MPDNDRPTVLPPQASTAVQVRPGTAVSTLVLPPIVAATEDDDALHFRDLWRIIVKRKWVVFAALLIVLATALVVTLMATPIFRASITLKIEREAAKVIDFKSVTPDESSWDMDFYRTQYELLKSRTLAERVVEQLNLRQRGAAKKDEAKPWWSGFMREWMGKDGDKGTGEAPVSEAKAQPQRGRGGSVPGVADRGADPQLAPGAPVLRLA